MNIELGFVLILTNGHEKYIFSVQVKCSYFMFPLMLSLQVSPSNWIPAKRVPHLVSYNVFNRRKSSYFVTKPLDFTISCRMDHSNESNHQKWIFVECFLNIHKNLRPVTRGGSLGSFEPPHQERVPQCFNKKNYLTKICHCHACKA